MHVTVGITVSSHGQSSVTGSHHGSVAVDGDVHGRWVYRRDGEITLTGGPCRPAHLARAIRAAVTMHMRQD